MSELVASRIANDDQELAQAIHEADMIAHVYERLACSLPKDFARKMTERWFAALANAEGEHTCMDCDGEMA